MVRGGGSVVPQGCGTSPPGLPWGSPQPTGQLSHSARLAAGWPAASASCTCGHRPLSQATGPGSGWAWWAGFLRTDLSGEALETLQGEPSQLAVRK